MTFLRALARNNNREWFKARKSPYDEQVKAPMVAVVEALDRDFRTMAPELAANPKTSIYRIYRDTRFSPDETPLKTHIARTSPIATSARGTARGSTCTSSRRWRCSPAACHPDAAAAPGDAHVHRRQRLALAINRRGASFRKAFTWEGEPQTRVPRGYPADHAAAEYLKCTRFVAWVEHPPRSRRPLRSTPPSSRPSRC